MPGAIHPAPFLAWLDFANQWQAVVHGAVIEISGIEQKALTAGLQHETAGILLSVVRENASNTLHANNQTFLVGIRRGAKDAPAHDLQRIGHSQRRNRCRSGFVIAEQNGRNRITRAEHFPAKAARAFWRHGLAVQSDFPIGDAACRLIPHPSAERIVITTADKSNRKDSGDHLARVTEREHLSIPTHLGLHPTPRFFQPGVREESLVILEGVFQCHAEEHHGPDSEVVIHAAFRDTAIGFIRLELGLDVFDGRLHDLGRLWSAVDQGECALATRAVTHRNGVAGIVLEPPVIAVAEQLEIVHPETQVISHGGPHFRCHLFKEKIVGQGKTRAAGKVELIHVEQLPGVTGIIVPLCKQEVVLCHEHLVEVEKRLFVFLLTSHGVGEGSPKNNFSTVGPHVSFRKINGCVARRVIRSELRINPHQKRLAVVCECRAVEFLFLGLQGLLVGHDHVGMWRITKCGSPFKDACAIGGGNHGRSCRTGWNLYLDFVRRRGADNLCRRSVHGHLRGRAEASALEGDQVAAFGQSLHGAGLREEEPRMEWLKICAKQSIGIQNLNRVFAVGQQSVGDDLELRCALEGGFGRSAIDHYHRTICKSRAFDPELTAIFHSLVS